MKILNYKHVDKGAILAKFDFQYHDIVIRRCTLFQKDGRNWIGFPSEPYEQDGVKKYFSFISVPERSIYDVLQAEILEAVKTIEPEESQPGETPQADDLPF